MRFRWELISFFSIKAFISATRLSKERSASNVLLLGFEWERAIEGDFFFLNWNIAKCTSNLYRSFQCSLLELVFFSLFIDWLLVERWSVFMCTYVLCEGMEWNTYIFRVTHNSKFLQTFSLLLFYSKTKTMARTRQTARKSTGGKTPRKQPRVDSLHFIYLLFLMVMSYLRFSSSFDEAY